MSNKEIIKEVLLSAFKDRELDRLVGDEELEKFTLLHEMLVKTNENMNITAITEPHRVALLHFADSICASTYLHKGARVIDVGCGGGFPCLPLAIVRGDLTFTALDSTAKKLTFVQSAADTLGLKLVTLAARAEDTARLHNYRESFDVCVSRAVARMNILSELCLPFVKTGGSFVALKGKNASQELTEAEKGIEALGGAVDSLHTFNLGRGEDEAERGIIVCKKIEKCPPSYPRAFAQIKKKPL